MQDWFRRPSLDFQRLAENECISAIGQLANNDQFSILPSFRSKSACRDQLFTVVCPRSSNCVSACSLLRLCFWVTIQTEVFCPRKSGPFGSDGQQIARLAIGRFELRRSCEFPLECGNSHALHHWLGRIRRFKIEHPGAIKIDRSQTGRDQTQQSDESSGSKRTPPGYQIRGDLSQADR